MFRNILLFISVSLVPIYIFKSGSIQPAHFLIFLFSVMVLIRYGFLGAFWINLLLVMSMYFFFREVISFMHTSKQGALIEALYFPFNAFITIALYAHILKSSNALDIIKSGVILSSIIATFGVILFGFSLVATTSSEFGRAIGTFNNPNQLGHFSVVISSITFLLLKTGNIGRNWAILILINVIFLALVSLSKAAMISVFVLLVIAIYPKQEAFKKTLLIVSTLTFFLLMSNELLIENFSNFYFYSRLDGMLNEGDSSLVSRGYLAFLEGNWIEFIFGLGSEKVGLILGHETHSTIFSQMNNYGIIGLFLIVGLLFLWVKSLYKIFGWNVMLGTCLPPMLYSITHNGSRFILFWLLIALSFALAKKLNVTHTLEKK